MAIRAVEAFDLVGSVGIELFLLADGSVAINEMAPRVHNSGHYTIEACPCSQFENHLRALLGWPLGDTSLITPAAVMVNLLGSSDGPGWPTGVEQALATPGAHLHIYGKAESKPGRKMGHLTLCGEALDTTLQLAREAAAHLRFGG
ncbi:MAG: ATP-grasp domain-containing protein, partial [Kiritimatiellae bacterium]|nr:ATP-grasp domain-containing protein [Kiritimatiellia bacterium]